MDRSDTDLIARLEDPVNDSIDAIGNDVITDEFNESDDQTISSVGDQEMEDSSQMSATDRTDFQTNWTIKDTEVVDKTPEKGSIVREPNGIRKRFNGQKWQRLCALEECLNLATSKAYIGLCSTHMRLKKKRKLKYKPKNKNITQPMKKFGSELNVIEVEDKALKSRRTPKNIRQMNKKLSLDVNDVLEELNEENKRLLNELLLVDKYLRVLNEFKTFIDFHSNDFKTVLNANECQKFGNFNKQINEIMNKINKTKDKNQRFEDKHQINEEPNDSCNSDEEVRNSSEEQNGVQSVGKGIKSKDSEEKGVDNSMTLSDDSFSPSDTEWDSDYDTHEERRRPRICHLDGCEKRFKNKKTLDEHLKEGHSSDSLMKCTFFGCPFIASSSILLERHLTDHPKKYLFRCTVDGCDKAFKTKRPLEKHMENHPVIESKFRCPFVGCGKLFKLQMQLTYHENKYHYKWAKREFRCEWPGCDFTTDQKGNITKHMKRNHTREYTQSCDHPGCGKMFMTSHELKKHRERVHEGVRNQRCSWPGCDYRSFQKCALERHRMRHTKEKPFACEWPGCQFRSSQKNNVKVHMLIHQKK